MNEILGGGLHPGKCVGLFGRFKSGKTLLGGQISQNLGRAGVRHVYVAAEMGSAQIEQRSLATEIGVNTNAFLRSDVRTNPGFCSRVGAAAIEGSESVFYCDAPGLNFDRLKRVILTAILSHKVKGIVLDYLQLVSGTSRGQTRVDFLEQVCQWLADTANRRKVWILVLGQLNSEGNARHGEAPLLAFDLVAEIHRQADGGPGAWLETRASRYTAPICVGSEMTPALFLDTLTGPRFTEGQGIAA